MAREISAVAGSGNTLKARLKNRAGLWWNGSTFEAYTAANYANYLITMTEEGVSGVYVGTFPAAITASGTYDYIVHLGSAEGDAVMSTGRIDWTGSASADASSAAMTGSEFYDYILRRGFKRTDKSTEVYEAITDAIQMMRRRFSFSEAEVDATTADTIAVLGDYKLTVESDMGLLRGVTLEDGQNATPLTKVNKSEFDRLYPDQAVTDDRGYPLHYCVYANQIYIGMVPDQITYTYRLSYSKRAGTVTSSTVGVPFTDVYRDVLADLVLARLWEDLEEYDKATHYGGRFTVEFEVVKARERRNSGEGNFNQVPNNL